MLELDIINANLVPNSLFRDPVKSSYAVDTFCVLKFFGKEVGRSSIVTNSFDPIWNEKFTLSFDDLHVKEHLYSRPFYFESIDLEIYECSPKDDKHAKVYEAKIPLRNVLFKSYKLLPAIASYATQASTASTPGSSDNSNTATERTTAQGWRGSAFYTKGQEQGADKCRIFVRINRLHDDLYANIQHFQFLELNQGLSRTSGRSRHLYIDLEQSTGGFTYRSGLPGPITGEQLVDRFDYVEVSHLFKIFVCPSHPL
jgi:hypothetical protein